jgi:hypothetical protein
MNTDKNWSSTSGQKHKLHEGKTEISFSGARLIISLPSYDLFLSVFIRVHPWFHFLPQLLEN